MSIEKNHLPKHIAIIMDGNGRWAKKRMLARSAGHAAGSETFRKIATYCSDIGIEYLTVYAFSTENWKRPGAEVNAIMSLLQKYLQEAVESLARDNIGLYVFGARDRLPDSILKLIEKTSEISKTTTGLKVGVCLDYGGRADILHAVKSVAKEAKNGKIGLDDITEDLLASRLYTADFPDPDLVIRTGGEVRLSNFLLWQSAYAELYFSDVLWPDFTSEDIDRAIESFASRNRRYGGV